MVAAEVERKPGDERREENNHGDGVVDEGAEEDNEDDEGVIDAEMVEVVAESGHGLGVVVGKGEGRDVEE